MRRKKIRVFANGDKVFGKVRGHSAWPARIELDPQKKYNNQTYRLRFYGAEDVATLKHCDIYPFNEYREKFVASCKKPDFINAVKLLVNDMTREELKKGISYATSISSDQGPEPALTNQELPTITLPLEVTSDERTQSSSTSSQQLYCDDDAKNLHFNEEVEEVLPTTVHEANQVSKKNSNTIDMDDNTLPKFTADSSGNLSNPPSFIKLQGNQDTIKCVEDETPPMSGAEVNPKCQIMPPKMLPEKKTIKRKDKKSNEEHSQTKKIKLNKDKKIGTGENQDKLPKFTADSSGNLSNPPSSIKLQGNEDIFKCFEDEIQPMSGAEVANQEENINLIDKDKNPLTDSPLTPHKLPPPNRTIAFPNVKRKENERKKKEGKVEKMSKSTLNIAEVDFPSSTNQELTSNQDVVAEEKLCEDLNVTVKIDRNAPCKRLDNLPPTTSHKTKTNHDKKYNEKRAKISKTGKKKEENQEKPSNFKIDSSGNYLYLGKHPNILIIPLNLNRPEFYLPSLNEEWNKVLLTEANHLIVKTKMLDRKYLQSFTEKMEAFTKQQAEIFKKKQMEFKTDVTSKFICFGKSPDLFIIPLDFNRPNFYFDDVLNQEWNEALLAYANSLVPQLVNSTGKNYTQIHQTFMDKIKDFVASLSQKFILKNK